MKRLWIVMSCMALGSISASAQQSWNPYVAHITETTVNVDSSGAKSTTVNHELKARSSNGDVVTQVFIGGSQTPVREHLYDATNGTAYEVNMDAKEATGKRQYWHHLQTPKDEPVGRTTIAGLTVTCYPMKNGATGKVGGKFCLADGTDITLRMEIDMPNGASYRMDTSSIQVGQEPQAALFKIPAGFEVSNPVK